MRLYKLTINGKKDIVHYERSSIMNRINEVLKQWINGNKYGFSAWTNKPKPVFQIITIK